MSPTPQIALGGSGDAGDTYNGGGGERFGVGDILGGGGMAFPKTAGVGGGGVMTGAFGAPCA
tara:strand:+ start:8779 stop:8964 length:186 start_codon:yes stop_codon:yes gene_type:complete